MQLSRPSKPSFSFSTPSELYPFLLFAYLLLIALRNSSSITFAPLTSTYHSLRDAAEANGQVFEYPSRKEFVKASVVSSNINGLIGQREVICSAKAIYRYDQLLNIDSSWNSLLTLYVVS